MASKGSAWMLCVALFIAGCGQAPFKAVTDFLDGGKGEPQLKTGVQLYEDGKYGEAARHLQTALDEGLARSSDQTKAHKYLAFIHCVAGRPTQCRDQFRKALEIDPAFELEPAEAGHPTWGPVFRSVKARH